MSVTIEAVESQRGFPLLKSVLLASSLLVGAHTARAQQAATETADAGNLGLEEIIVTARKREENLQSVAVSVQAFSTKKLEELTVSSFDDYSKLLPSLSFQSTAPGNTNLYIRGVATGGDGLAVGSLPSVGLYLDEQPITTIAGALDIHIYDIQRIEALSGPQGSLFGASSEAGTVRIITNKPEIGKFSAAIDLEGNHVTHGNFGYSAEGFANIPINDRMAVRLVGYYQRDAGYIDNVPSTRDYPTWGQSLNNAQFVEDNFNDTETYGGRAALKIDLDDNWTTNLSVIGQEQLTHGTYGYNPSIGDLRVSRFGPDQGRDKWVQAGLTIEGKIGRFDLVYAGAFLARQNKNQFDYSDYSFYYDVVSGYYFTDDGGNLINPNQQTPVNSRYTKTSHELRVQSPSTDRLRAVAGLFFQRQVNDYEAKYNITGLATAASITGQPGTLYLNQQHRVDRDYAVFGELSYDILEKLTATIGGRYYAYRNSVTGFFGFNSNETRLNLITGEPLCRPVADQSSLPCINIDQTAKANSYTYKFNLTWKFDDDRLIYGTISNGYRPGGINRRAELPPYRADFLTNYEIGVKTSWFDRRLRLNAAIYNLEWKDTQYAFTGANGITQIANAGDARIKGVEADFSAVPYKGVTVSGALAYTDAKLVSNFCRIPDVDPQCATPDGNRVLAADGSRLPVTPRFKGNVTTRYNFEVAGLGAHVQGTSTFQSSLRSELRQAQADALGNSPPYVLFDFTAGVEKNDWSAEFFVKNAFDARASNLRSTPCNALVCQRVYSYVARPQTFGLRFGQKF